MCRTFEILAWGDLTAELDRVGIEPKVIYEGCDSGDKCIRLYLLSVTEFSLLVNSKEPRTWLTGGTWVWPVMGENVKVNCQFTIKGFNIKAWRMLVSRKGNTTYANLLEYFKMELGLEDTQRISLLCKELATQNKLELSELLDKYQSKNILLN